MFVAARCSGKKVLALVIVCAVVLEGSAVLLEASAP